MVFKRYTHPFGLTYWEVMSIFRLQKMLRNLLMRKDLLLVLKLRMPEKQFGEWKRPLRNKNESLGPQESRFVQFVWQFCSALLFICSCFPCSIFLNVKPFLTCLLVLPDNPFPQKKPPQHHITLFAAQYSTLSFFLTRITKCVKSVFFLYHLLDKAMVIF